MQDLFGISDKRYACKQDADINMEFNNSVNVDLK
jgi:hypothetical protein